MKLTHEILQGSWIVAGSEIEHVGQGDEIYHFTPPDRFVMEFKQPNGPRYLSKQRYALTDEGFVYGPEGNLRCAVTAWLESGFLIFRPIHGKETWSTSMTNQENQPEQIGALNPDPVSSGMNSVARFPYSGSVAATPGIGSSSLEPLPNLPNDPSSQP